MKYIGISQGFHDAAWAVMHDDKIQFMSHAERYSRKKGDKHLPFEWNPHAWDTSIYYENIELKNRRRAEYGMAESPQFQATHYVDHHESHMGAAYYTAPFIPDATVVVDAIGEYDTASIWVNGQKVWSKQYPWSLGLFYSAITKRIGLKPNEDEYITMGMAAFGTPKINMEEVMSEYLHTGIPLKRWFWERPEDIAEYYYGSTDYTWLVYMSNNILDPYHQWPMAEADFINYLIEKYGAESGRVGDEVVEWTKEDNGDNIIYYYREV